MNTSSYLEYYHTENRGKTYAVSLEDVSPYASCLFLYDKLSKHFNSHTYLQEHITLKIMWPISPKLWTFTLKVDHVYQVSLQSVKNWENSLLNKLFFDTDKPTDQPTNQIVILYAIWISGCEGVKSQKLCVWGLDPATTLTFWPQTVFVFHMSIFYPHIKHDVFMKLVSHCFIPYIRLGRHTTTTTWPIFTYVLSSDLILWLLNMKLCVSSYLKKAFTLRFVQDILTIVYQHNVFL